MNNVIRLSLFRLKKNRKEAIAIAFLTMVTSMMLTVFAVNSTKMDKAFDDSFEASGSYNTVVMIDKERYRDEYRDLLEQEYGIDDIVERDIVYPEFMDVVYPSDEKSISVLEFVTEKTERKIESFTKREQLPEEEIAELSHPIWLPVYFSVSKGCKPGDTITLSSGGKDYPFEIAGFYETGLLTNERGYGQKCVISDSDYALFATIFSSSGGVKRTLWFNSGKDFSYEVFMKQCTEVSYENLAPYFSCMTSKEEKELELMFLTMFMGFMCAFSLITMLSALLMIMHRISDDIEDQMQQIGVLEALGYTAREISLSYVFEYVICGGIGAVIGSVASLFIDPLMNRGVQSMMGRSVKGHTDPVVMIAVPVFITVLVIVFALIKAAAVKKYPPVVAFRKGIKTHHFGRNILPLEKAKGNINITLAMRSFLKDIRSSVGTAVCTTAAGISIMFCITGAWAFKDGAKSFEVMENVDQTVQVTLTNGTDPYKVRDEIASMPEVRKALVTYKEKYYSVKGSDIQGTVIVYKDYNDSESIGLLRGRLPEHDNEVVITIRRTNETGLDIGDSIVIEGSSIDCKYVITGITSTLYNNGMMMLLTEDGYRRMEVNARPGIISVYPAEGVTERQFINALYEKYGLSVKDSMSLSGGAGDLEERIRSAADEKIAMLVSNYGVTNTDYAIVVGDKVITGNSRHFVIKDTFAMRETGEQSLAAVGAVSKYGSAGGAVVITIVVAVILGLIVSSDVKRQRHSLGVMKGLGYSSKDLMTQMAIKIMPVTVVSLTIGAFLGGWLFKEFFMVVFGAAAVVSVPVLIAADILMIVFCYIVTYFCAGKVKEISVTELMTE